MANRRKQVTEEELLEHYTPEELAKISGGKVDYEKNVLTTAIKSYTLKITPSTLPKEIVLLHGIMANQGTATQKHGLFTYMDYPIWQKYFSNITLNEMARMLAVGRIATPLGLSYENEDSFVYNTRKKRGRIVRETLEKYIKFFSEAPDFVDMTKFFGGLEYNLLAYQDKQIADFLFNVPLPIFVQATALYLMDSYFFRQRTVKKFKKTFIGEDLVIAGGENYFINLKKLEEKGLTLKDLSNPNREYSESEIKELILDGVLVVDYGEQRFSPDNLYDYDHNFARSGKGLGTSDSLAFAFASYIFGPWGSLTLRLHDNLDTLVKGIDDYTYKEFEPLLKKAHSIVGSSFKTKYGIDFEKTFGEFDEVLAAAMIAGNEKVRDMFLNFLSSGAVERFIYLIAKNNVPYEEYVNGYRKRFKSSIGMRHNHNLYELVSDYTQVAFDKGFINGKGKVKYDTVPLEKESYHTLINNPLFGFTSIGQLLPFYSDMPADWSEIHIKHVADEFYKRLHHVQKRSDLLLKRKAVSLKDYPYKNSFPVYFSGFPKNIEPIMKYF